MTNAIRCFWLEKTALVEMDLRRFKHAPVVNGTSVRECPAPENHGYHNAHALIGQSNRDDCTDVHGDSWPHSDPRWPTHCSCRYEFAPGDEWQFNPNRLYRRVDTGELMTLQRAPAGAMTDADWLRDRGYSRADGLGYKCIDGITLQVKTPDGWWCVDGPSYNNRVAGPGWTRTGQVPEVTAHPSILMTNYHGWLRDGYLVEC
jgi:hypothetical protein